MVWAEPDGRIHAAFGFHRTPGFQLATAEPGGGGPWEQLPAISQSVSYPQVHRIAGGRTLVYFRESGHLGFWTYRISGDGGRSWQGPAEPVIDMDAPPHESPLASHAGSYQTTRVGPDGRTLHIAFIWKVEEPLPSERYGGVLHDYTRRHNLYYVRADLETGRVFNAHGKELPRPVRFGTAQRDCLVWDTEGGSASVGPVDRHWRVRRAVLPAACLRRDAVQVQVPFRPLRRREMASDPRWPSRAIPSIRPTSPAGRTGRSEPCWLPGDGEASESGEMNRYGWGDRIEEWVSDPSGAKWSRSRDLTPRPGLRYQSVKWVRGEQGGILDGILLFYAWQGDGKAHAYLLDERE